MNLEELAKWLERNAPIGNELGAWQRLRAAAEACRELQAWRHYDDAPGQVRGEHCREARKYGKATDAALAECGGSQ